MALYQRVQYLSTDGSIDVLPQATGGVALGAGLFVTPRAFTYNTYAGPGVFNLERQGLVSLMAFDAAPPWGGSYADGGFRAVTKPDGTMDVLPFMQAMAWLCSYGANDEGLTHAARLTTARDRFLEMRCGPTTAFVMACAASVGVTTRQVHLLDISNPIGNGFDDGHVLCEARVRGSWCAFDVPNDLAFADGDDLLPLHRVIKTGVANCDQIVLAPSGVGRDSPTWVHAYHASVLAAPTDKARWLKRVYEVPGMALPNGGICWGVPDHLANYTSQIMNYPGTGGLWTTLPFEQWVAAYY